jgi:hypothetical protein
MCVLVCLLWQLLLGVLLLGVPAALYDPTTNTISLTGAMAAPRREHSLVFLLLGFPAAWFFCYLVVLLPLHGRHIMCEV